MEKKQGGEFNEADDLNDSHLLFADDFIPVIDQPNEFSD